MFSYDPYAALAELRPVPPLALTSPDFAQGGALPLTAWSRGRGGADLTPRLRWSAVPAGARSLAISCFDPDAPTGSGFWHWAAFDLPPDLSALESIDGSASSLPAGAKVMPNEQRSQRYIGAAPPAGTGVHRYFFVVDALDVETLDLDGTETPAVLGFNRHFHTLARGILVGTADPAEH